MKKHLSYRFIVFLALFQFGFIQLNHAQTIAAPVLQCVVNDFTNNDVKLDWINTANSCGSFNSYKIYGANNRLGPYSLLATITNSAQTTWSHTGAASGTWFYYMEADFNCPSALVLQSDTIQNEANPRTPEIISVSVDCDGHPLFCWKPSPSPQTRFYIVYVKLPNGNVVPIDSVDGRNNTCYHDLRQFATNDTIKYTVSAADSCSGNQPSAFNTSPHQNILLRGVISNCERNVRLDWSSYQNFPQGVKKYIVYANVNNTGFAETTQVDAILNTYNYTGFNDGDSICFQIGAQSAEDTTIIALSNCLCMRVAIVQPPKYVYPIYASVLADNKIEFVWLNDVNAELLTNNVENSADCNTYQSVNYLSVPVPVHFRDTLIDSFAQPTVNSYCYRVTAVDSCQGQKVSPTVKTIFLEGELSDYYEAVLNWNSFEIFGGVVLQYNLYRDYGAGFQLIKTLSPTINSYKDSLYSLLNEKGNFCYKIEALYTLDLPDVPFSGTFNSFSNVICIEHRPIIYIPNAFVPNGVNNEFKPRIIFGDPANYSLLIFNRYGAKIFESNNVNTGWNGRDNKGVEYQQGGYGYLIKFTAADGTSIERKGIVLLIRN